MPVHDHLECLQLDFRGVLCSVFFHCQCQESLCLRMFFYWPTSSNISACFFSTQVSRGSVIGVLCGVAPRSLSYLVDVGEDCCIVKKKKTNKKWCMTYGILRSQGQKTVVPPTACRSKAPMPMALEHLFRTRILAPSITLTGAHPTVRRWRVIVPGQKTGMHNTRIPQRIGVLRRVLLSATHIWLPGGQNKQVPRT